MNIKGIGEKSFLKLKPMVTVGAAEGGGPDASAAGDSDGRCPAPGAASGARVFPELRRESSDTHVTRSGLRLGCSRCSSRGAWGNATAAGDSAGRRRDRRDADGDGGALRRRTNRRRGSMRCGGRAPVALRFEALDGDYVFAPFRRQRQRRPVGGDSRRHRPALARSSAWATFPACGSSWGRECQMPTDGPGRRGRRPNRIGAALDDELGWHGDVGNAVFGGRRGQYAVRVLGATGRTRMLAAQPETRSWLVR